MKPRLSTFTILLCAVVGVSAPAYANSLSSEYSISLYGLKVGTSKFSTTITNSNYKISGTLRASGVAKLLTSTSGSLTASGKVSSSKIVASSFDVKYKEGKRAKRTTISFSGGNVSNISVSPAVKKKGDWVELQSTHLKNVLDPMAATLVFADSLRTVCSNTLKIFDGAMRADFPMRYLRTIPFSAKGYKGDAVTCRANFKPIAGYDRKKKDVVWMRDKGYLDISFAPIGTTGFFAPVAAKIKTNIGIAVIRARRFQTVKN